MSTLISMVIETIDRASVDEKAILFSTASATGLVELLKGSGPVSVFVPKDETFITGSAERFAALLHDEEALITLLTAGVDPEVEASEAVQAQLASVSVSSSKALQFPPTPTAGASIRRSARSADRRVPGE